MSNQVRSQTIGTGGGQDLILSKFVKVLNSLSILSCSSRREPEKRPPPPKPTKFSKDKEQSTPQPALSIDSRKIF